MLTPDGTGKVGIGTTAVGNFDSVPLLVVGGGTADSGIVIYTSNATSGYLQFADGTSGAEEYRGFIKYDHSLNAMSFSTNSTARTEAEMTIISSGNVGIGTATPVYKTQIVSTANKLLQLNGNNTTGLVDTGFTITADDAKNIYLLQMENAGLAFGTNMTTYMFMNTNGNLALGNTSPNASSLLELQSTSKGFLPPRMTTTQKNAIASPAAGLVIYDTTLNKLCVRVAAAWQTVTSA